MKKILGSAFILILGSCGPVSNKDSSSNNSNSTGSLDTTFYENLGTGFNAPVRVLKNGGSRGMYIGGDFETIKGLKAKRLARLSNDGVVDTAFLSNLGEGFNGSVRAIAVQADGSILVGGEFTKFNGVAVPYLVRLNANGILDTTFQATLGDGPNNNVYAIQVNASKEIYIGGAFNRASGYNARGIAKYDSSGNLNSAFVGNSGSGVTGIVYTIHLITDALVIGGRFTEFNGHNIKNIAKLHSWGSLDTSFLSVANNAFDNDVYDIKGTSLNRWVIGGVFSTFSSVSVGHFIRLFSNGSTDTAYTPSNGGFGPSSAGIRSLFVQSDEKIVAGGDFTSLSGASKSYLVRLNSDLTVDENFSTAMGTGIGNSVYAIEADSGGKLFIGGNFTSFNGNAIGYLVRLN